VFGADLVLTRTISARVGEPRVRIEDTVRNEGYRPEPLMLLYHINLGWPLLDETARLVGPGDPGEPPEPRDAEAHKGLKDWDTFAAPTPGFRERVFYHRPRADAQGWAEARLENPSLEGGIALSVRFRPEQLPQFVQWTMTGEGTYVVGLEPADLAELTPRHRVTQRGGAPEPKRICDGLRVHRPRVPHPPLLVIVAVIGEAGLPSMRVPHSGVIP
jgi:hypothetical protein